MIRLPGIAVVFLAMMLGWIGIGLFMLIAPARFGNLVHDALMLFPEVNKGDWGRKLVLRIAGIGLIAFAVRFVLRLV